VEKVLGSIPSYSIFAGLLPAPYVHSRFSFCFSVVGIDRSLVQGSVSISQNLTCGLDT
jgi:hypothetical protein